MESFARKGNRAAVEVICGIACYEGVVKDEAYIGKRVGVVATSDDANVWLDGGYPESLVLIASEAPDNGS